MAAFTNAAIANSVNWFTGNASPTATGTRYITIFNGDPQGAGSEVINQITGSSTRPAITFTAVTGQQANNNATVSFTSSAVGPNTVTHVAIYSASTAGTLLGSAAVTNKAITAGDSLSIPTNNCAVAIV